MAAAPVPLLAEDRDPPGRSGLFGEVLRELLDARQELVAVGAVHQAVEFDALTLKATGVLRFTPGTIAGRPVKTWVELPIQWSPCSADQARRGAGAGFRALYCRAQNV